MAPPKGFIPWNKGLKGIHLSPSTEIKKGQHLSRATEFKKGNRPARPIQRGQRISIETEFTSGRVKGINNTKWKGDRVGYFALHGWLYRNKKRTRTCEFCGFKRRTHFANKSGKYKRDLSDWIELCQRCHIRYDKDNGTWGINLKNYGNK